MNQIEIQKALIGMLLELRAGTGEGSCDVTPTTAPLKDLGFFDSLLALETTIALEERLGATFGVDNVFADEESEEPLSIADIAERLAKNRGASK